MSAFALFVRVPLKAEHRAEGMAAIRGILDDTRAEPGCHMFVLHESEDDDTPYLYERWENQAALDAHYAQPYVTEVFKKFEDWLSEPIAIKRLSPGE